ncbi:MAG: hypothetical protein GX801_04910 [Fibrobacter sp.]|nr:hypothetical protein [Fibrobacter sp.]
MRIALLLFTAVFFLVSCGDGSEKSFHNNGNVKERWFEAKAENGKMVRHGSFERFDDKGNKRDSINYNMNQRHGIEISWHPNGEIAKKCNWTDGFLDGLCDEFTDQGQKVQSVTWVKGKLHGPKLIWNREGVKTEEIHYKDGLQDSLYQRWNDKGVLKHSVTYLEGRKHGEEKMWCEEEQYADVIREQRIWEHGKREGIETYYVCIDGEISGILTWENDKMHGPYTYWEEGDQVTDFYEENEKIEEKTKRIKNKPKPKRKK